MIEVISRIINVILILIILLVILFTWMWYRNPYYLISWWNDRLISQSKTQNLNCMNGIPSYQNAWLSENKNIVEFHRLINLYHDEILFEVTELLQNDSLPSFDSTFPKWLKEEQIWNPIWIRFMGQWSPLAEKIPTLQRIANLFPDVTLLYISIFNPGSTVIENQSPYRSVYRYHYGLMVPENDIGLKIDGYDVKWQEKEGYIWDDTLLHSAWNHSNEPRIIIFADIKRELPLPLAWGSDLIYTLLQRTVSVKQIKSEIQNKLVTSK